MALTQNAVPRTPWRAQWNSAANASPQAQGVFHFRKSIDLPDKPEQFIVNISADNRYRLLVNGQLASSGPARGDPAHWRYETADLAPYLHAGRNVLAALVWNWGDYRPTAQMSLRTGFLLSGENEHSADTNDSWKAVADPAYSFSRVGAPDDGGFYAASPGENLDARLYPWGWESPTYDDTPWPAATPLAAMPALRRATEEHGQSNTWQLVPRNIPSMEERPVSFARIRRADGVKVNPGFITGGPALLIPAHQRISVLLDQDQLTTGYVVLGANGGAGASVTLTYAEALFDADGRKGDRDDIVGGRLRG